MNDIGLVDLDLQAGRQAVALQRLDQADLTNQTADVSMLRAHLRADQGNIEGAVLDARRAFKFSPELPGLVELFVAVLARSNQAMREIRIQEGMIRKGRAQLAEGRIDTGLAWRNLLVARLYVLLGQEQRLGRLQVGYAADIVGVRGDPVTDVRAVTRGVQWVMKGGKVVVDRAGQSPARR